MVTINESNGKVMIFGNEKSTDVGTYSFQIKTCLWNELYLTEINCVLSQTVTFTMIDPCTTSSINPFQLSRTIRAAYGKQDDFIISGPYSSVDASTSMYGIGKCGKMMCGAFLQDRSQPVYLTVENRVYNSIDNSYNTKLVLKPASGRDATGIFNVNIDCGLTDYPNASRLLQTIKVEITATSTARLLH